MTSSPATEVRVDPRPFDLPGEAGAAVAGFASGSVGALCLHGLSATPWEVRPIAEALARRGVRCVGPVQPGHGDTKERLAASNQEEWVDAASAQLASLRERHDRVVLVGVSMGGLVSLLLASRTPVTAVVTVGVPLRLKAPPRWLVRGIAAVWPYLAKRGGSDIREPAARARHPSLAVMPVRSVAELMRLQERVREALVGVRAPLFVAHGALDRTADPADAREIHDGVGSTEKRLRVYARSGHIATVDYDGPQLASDAAEFVAPHLGDGATGPGGNAARG